MLGEDRGHQATCVTAQSGILYNSRVSPVFHVAFLRLKKRIHFFSGVAV